MGGPSVVGLTVGAWLQLQGVPVFPWQQAQPPYGEGLNCSSVPRSKPPALWGPRRPPAGKALLSAVTVTAQSGEPGRPVLSRVSALQSQSAHIF